MERKLPSSLILIVFGVIQIFFNHVIIAPYLYKLNFKLAFFILLFIYLIQTLLFIFLKNKYENIRIFNLEYFKRINSTSYHIFFIFLTLISIILILYLIYFFFTFLDYYFFVNAKFIFIIPLLLIVTSFAIFRSFYAIFQCGIIIFIILSIQFFIFFFAPKNIEVSVFLPLNFDINSNNIAILLLLPSIIFFPLLSLPCATIASTPYRTKEILLISILFFVFNSYFLFIQTKQLGATISYLEHPFYIIFDALDLGFYTEHLYIVPVALCIITTFLFINILLHTIRTTSCCNSNSKILLMFSLILIIAMYLFTKAEIFSNLLYFLIYMLSASFIILFIIHFFTYHLGRSKYETNR